MTPAERQKVSRRPRTALGERARGAYASLLLMTGIAGRARKRLNGSALVLMYHRVIDDEAVPAGIDPGMYVTRSAFDRHLRYLRARHDVIGLDDLLHWMKGVRTYSRTPCVITFDDGWEDNYQVAYPQLRKMGLTATIFLITDRIGSVGMVSWEQVREMNAAGVQFGSHTATHPVLPAVPDPMIVDELTRSRDRLERELQQPCRWFCYPKGRYDERSISVARDLYVGALSTDEGPVNAGDDLHRLRRIGIHNDVTRTPALFACRLVSLV